MAGEGFGTLVCLKRPLLASPSRRGRGARWRFGLERTAQQGPTHPLTDSAFGRATSPREGEEEKLPRRTPIPPTPLSHLSSGRTSAAYRTLLHAPARSPSCPPRRRHLGP